jgi:saccharopine dehydrogenase-like NADP-dependent oxidoreductase
MNQVLWIGVYPGLTEAMVNYMLQALHELKNLR